MTMGLTSIIETVEEIDISNKPLGQKPRDVRAQHCKTARELELFNFSSSYQTFSDGMDNLETSTGIQCGSSGTSEFVTE